MIDQFLNAFPALDFRIGGLDVFGTIIFVLGMMAVVSVVGKVKCWEKK